ncbi:MAG: amidohydrolase family protein, partial [Acidimicrobiales bacterium]|nr:amidohydrolase family protein [Acidimicrobiales bacterium]
PTLTAEIEEMVGIAEAVGSTGTGVLQLVGDFRDFDDEFRIARAMAERSGRPISISVAQAGGRPEQWKALLDSMAAATDEGVTMRAQVGARAVGILLGLQATLSPFMKCPTYRRLAELPLEDRVVAMAAPEVKQAIISELSDDLDRNVLGARVAQRWDLMFALGDPPQYEPSPHDSVEATARRMGVEPASLAYDLMLERGGQALLYVPSLNYVDGNLDVVREQLMHPVAVPGLSDGGAHVGTICDVSFPTTLMQWWGRDRPHGRIPLETIVHKQARATARAVGLNDRGLLAPGYKADINVVDFDSLTLHAPVIVGDLPAGGRRLLQRVTGIDHTFVSGVEVCSNSESTGETPGRLVRGARG